MEGGIDDVGLGVLFGLELYRYEFTALLMHAEHLEAAFGVGPHTISVPRIRRADDIDPSTFDNGIDDDTFAKIVACIRISTPYTGMIISTRESKNVENAFLNSEFLKSVEVQKQVLVVMHTRRIPQKKKPPNLMLKIEGVLTI